MADNVLNPVVDDFVGDRNGLFRIAGVVILHAYQLVALDAAFGVDVFDGLTRAVKLHVTPLGNRAGHRTDYRNFNLFRHGRMRDRQCNHSRDKCLRVPFHLRIPIRDVVFIFCFIMVKKHSVLLMNNAIFTSAFNGLAQFFVKNQTKISIFQAIKER